MSRAVIRKPSSSIATFKPEEAGKRAAQADAVIAYAKRIKDWPLLEQALDQKLDDQQAFVEWWTEAVTVRQSPGGRDKSSRADRRSMLSVEKAEKTTGISHQQVAKWKRRLEDRASYRAMLYGTTYQKAMAEQSDTTALKWTGDPESYTPAAYVDAAREVMGGIDLDPASNELAQKTVKAAKWYGVEADGLTRDWTGTVFLNPPYSHPEVAHFIEKLCVEYEARRVTRAVLLTNNNTDTKWWHRAAQLASAVCFTVGRINFYKADGSQTQPTNGQTFFYMGDNGADFLRVFGTFGLIMTATKDGAP